MADVTYEIVEHDGGWAYKVDGVFSETFRTQQDAHDAAEIAANEQRHRVPGGGGTREGRDRHRRRPPHPACRGLSRQPDAKPSSRAGCL